MNQSDEFEKLSFEEAMKELEAIVGRLDAGEGTLDESISLFQKGVQLSKLCSARLEEIEKRVRILTDESAGSRKEIPFAEDSAIPAEKE